MDGKKKDLSLKGFYEAYKEPNEIWDGEQFKNLKLGWLKASEMEIYFAYMLMYMRKDLHKSTFEIADLYGYTESKVAKLQIEFSRRFKIYQSIDDDTFLKAIFGAMIGDSPSIVVLIDDTKLSFAIKDAADARRIRRIASERGLVIGGGINKQEFSLLPFVFASLFSKSNHRLSERMKECILKNASKESLKEVFPEEGEIITAKGIQLLKDIGREVLIGVIKASLGL